jgi:phosphoribosylamine--glycine ligase
VSSSFPMKVLVLGSGGREHAIAWRLGRDPDVREVVTAPGNPGIQAIGRCLDVQLDDPRAVLALAEGEGVDLTVVGPEAPLQWGVANHFRAKGRAIVGPSRIGAALECSKVYAKQFMQQAGIPTARFEVCEALEAALEAVSGDTFGFPVVVKADGLAAGKGVTVALDRAEAEAAVREAMVDRRFGSAGSTLVVEECLTGPELSFFLLLDGERALPLGTAQDHKRIWDDDRGPNTGGMGAFAPSPLMTPTFAAQVVETVVRPVLAGTRAAGEPYQGFLYVSLMLTPAGPKVIEFNVRFGDPEAQVVLPSLDGPFARALYASATGRLDEVALTTSADCLVGVVLAAPGYPGVVATGRPIAGAERAAAMPNVMVFHAGTRIEGDALVTAGGRVLTVVGRDSTYEAAMDRAYEAVSKIAFEGMQYRRDIGRKAAGRLRESVSADNS